MINQRIHQLRDLMKKEKIDLYVIPTADDHQSEYISDYYKTRVFMSGFTGSAGTMVVTQEHAALWTDGRYHVQAEQQLKGTCVELFKMGLEGVPTFLQMIEQWTCKGSVLGFDGKTMSAALGRELEHIAERKQASLAFDQDLVGVIWEDRPALPSGKVWPLAVQYSGTDRNEKLKELREDMLQVKADVHVLSALDEIAWLMNLRGSDVAHTPVFLSFMIIDQKNCTLYINRAKIEAELKAEMEQQNIYLKEYDEFMRDLEQIKNQRIWCDSLKCHYAMVKTMKTHDDILDQPSSIVLKKACKNLRLTNSNVDNGEGSEIAEILLYAFMQEHFKALSVVPKIFYKQNSNIYALGADSVHIVLEKNGFYQYEVSNFAKPGSESRHNTVYWHIENYLGCGAGATGTVDYYRWNNLTDLEKYVDFWKNVNFNDFTENCEQFFNSSITSTPPICLCI